jgi:hypothetical protein
MLARRRLRSNGAQDRRCPILHRLRKADGTTIVAASKPFPNECRDGIRI